GRPPVNPLTTRQLNRLFHMAAGAAEIRKGATLHSLRHSFCNPPAREQARYPNDSGSARPQAAGYDRALHTRRHRSDLQGGEPTRSAEQPWMQPPPTSSENSRVKGKKDAPPK